MAVKKEHVDKAKKTGASLCMDFHEMCYLCGFEDFGERILLKIPEGVCLCLDCSIKKNIPTENEDRVLYEIGKGVVFESNR